MNMKTDNDKTFIKIIREFDIPDKAVAAAPTRQKMPMAARTGNF